MTGVRAASEGLLEVGPTAGGAPTEAAAPPAGAVSPPGTVSSRTAGPGRLATRGPLLVLLVIALVLVGCALGGLRVFVVESPSMGRAAPVGTLVVGTVHAGDLHVGDVVTYRPQERSAMPYTHRVVQVVPGGVRTRGDVNGADDPWLVTPSMVVARAVLLVPGVGWLLRGAPILLGGVLVVQVACVLLRSSAARLQVRLLGGSMTVAVLSFALRPFSGFVLMQSSERPAGLQAEVVSTALLPIRLVAKGGDAVVLQSGQVGRLLLPGDALGRVTMSSQLALDWAGWVLVALACATPLIVVLVFGVPVDEEDADGAG